MNTSTLILAGEVYEMHEEELPQDELKFYIDNPRFYSYFNRAEEDPTQAQIEDVMCKSDSVRELKNAIESVGGLVEPLKVIDGSFIVVEGNRRLAAYRMLAKKDIVKWDKVRCNVLPSDISCKAVFALLGQHHMNGQNSWKPFETAGYLYRRIEATGSTSEVIARELSAPPATVRQYYCTYDFMVKHGDLREDHWNYYMEYLRSKAIKKKRLVQPKLDDVFVNSVVSGQLTNAIKDVRDKLEVIAKLPSSKGDQLIEDYIRGVSLDECCKNVDCGKDIKNQLSNFRKLISDPSIKRTLRTLTPAEREAYVFELKRINVVSAQMLEDLSQNNLDSMND